jgi:hypothetical protein
MMPESDVMVIDGVPVTTPLRTTIDLARDRWAERGFAQAEAMVRAGVVDREEVLKSVDRFKGYRFIRQVRSFAPLLDPRPQSVCESILRFRWYQTCAPYPEPQRPVIGPQRQEWALDLGVDELFLAVEYDGREFHEGDEAEDHDADRRAWIERNTPWIVHVVRDENLFGPKADFDLLLPGWIRDARRSRGDRIRRAERGERAERVRWYTDIGD